MLLVIRHGETPLNAARIVQRPETALSAVGLAQAERLAERLATTGVARILSSDLRRAMMTAERVRAATGAPVELEPLLQERNFGDVRGTPYAEHGCDIFALGYEPPGGETWEAFHDRVARAWAAILAAAGRTDGNLAVVTHGLVCRAIVERHCAVPGQVPVPLAWANTSVTTIEATTPFRVRGVNCIAHLEAGSGSAPGVV
jgi:probable phosphoglycerate mutase